MRIGKVVFLTVLSFCVSAQAQYDENIMLDLSVLDNLGGEYSVTNEPLFPVLPKETKKPSIKKIRKKAKKAVAQQKAYKSEAAPIAPQEKNVEIKREEVKEMQVTSEPKEEIVVVDKEPIADDSATIVPVDVEPAPIATPQAEETPVADEAPVQITATEPTVETPSETTAEAPLTPPSENSKTELLVEEKQPLNEEKAPLSITFAPDSDELTVEQMTAIDNAVGKFKNEKNNKIAIYSYNLDDGVDSFRKKRISLNRALAVRTYLIKQEYKNFSIKVININGGSDKVNTVELEEI